jgi:Ca2+-binding RTX toxin-like protein
MATVYGSDNGEVINLVDGVTYARDVIYGYGGNDTIYGYGGDDFIYGGTGADTLYGGSGVDTSAYLDSAEGVYVSLAGNFAVGGTAQGDTFSSIENLTGSMQADTLIGDDGNNILVGLGSDDALHGGEGADRLFGDAGNDLLKGGGGADRLDGTSGIDTVSYITSSAGVSVSLSGFGSAAGGDAAGDTLYDIENLTGSDYNDQLTGDFLSNSLRGEAGSDSLYGMDGADTLQGDEQGDILDGGLGVDTLSYTASDAGVVINLGNGMAMGGHATGDTILNNENILGSAHADTLIGDGLVNVLTGLAGNDFLFGGVNNDVFAFNSGFGHDTILDFAPGGDDIQFSTSVFTSFAQVMANAAQVGSDVVITKDASNTITLDNVLLGSLTASDFIFV